MLDMTVIILTRDEQVHIKRCIESLLSVAKHIYIIDSGSSDNTVQISKELGAEVFFHEWVNYADQFQWALDHCNINTEWVMRMDADEYLERDLIHELNSKLIDVPSNVTGIYIKRKVIFKGRWIRYGGFYPHVLLRVWRNGVGNIEQRWMDEHIVLDHGDTVVMENDLVDENMNSIGWWVDKHNSYATREMIDLMAVKYQLFEVDHRLKGFNDPQAGQKRKIKERIYSRLPLGVRPVLYFMYRYFLRVGFLDGWPGFVFHFMQGLWYRLLVDVKVYEFEVEMKKTGSTGKALEYFGIKKI